MKLLDVRVGVEVVCSLLLVPHCWVKDCDVGIGPRPTLGMRVGVEVVCSSTSLRFPGVGLRFAMWELNLGPR